MWAQIINAVLGVWLLAAPAVLGYGSPAATNDRIIGPVVVTFAVVACWEATRNVRWLNLPLGLWLLAAPAVLGYDATTAIVGDMAVGAAVAGLSLVKGRVEQSFGGGWRSLFRSNPAHEQAARRVDG